MLMKNLTQIYKKKVIAIEIDKHDFSYFNDKNMISISSNKLGEFFSNYAFFDVALVDLGNGQVNDICNDVIYLIEPSLYRVNQIMMINNHIFDTLKGKKVVLNRSLLTDRDISVFAKEAGISIYYSLPPLNDRIINNEINGLLSKLGLVEAEAENSDKKGLFSFFK